VTVSFGAFRLISLIESIFRVILIDKIILFAVLLQTLNSVSSQPNFNNTLCEQHNNIPSNAIYYTDKELNSATEISDSYIVISGAFYINHINVKFINCIFNIEPQAYIYILGNKRLVLDNCKMFCCDAMWAGIIVDSKGLLICTNGTHIEDGLKAIQLRSNSKLTIRESILNRNSIGIETQGLPTIYQFKDNNIGMFGPTGLNNGGGVTYGISGGVDLSSVASGINLFYNLTEGINCWFSSLFVQNCQFQNCDFGIKVREPLNLKHTIKGFGKYSSTPTFLNNYVAHVSITGNSITDIHECIFNSNLTNSAYIDLSNNVLGNILFEKNYVNYDLFDSNYDNGMVTPLTGLVLWNNVAMKGLTIQKNTFNTTQNASLKISLFRQIDIRDCKFITSAIITKDTFNLNNITCSVNGSPELESSSCPEFTCLSSKSIFVRATNNLSITNDNLFNKTNSRAESIYLSGCNDISIMNNTFNDYNRYIDCSNTGIKIIASKAFVCSNILNNNYVGIEVKSQSLLSVITGNTFYANSIGVHYRVDAIVGKQEHRGNIWNGGFSSGYRLIHEGDNTFNSAHLNQYWIAQNNYFTMLNYWPSSFNPTPFVINDNDTLKSCIRLTYISTGDLRKIDSLPFGYKWESYYSILRDIEYYGFYGSEDYENIYDSLRVLPIYELLVIENEINDLGIQLEIFLDTINNAYEEVNNILQEIEYEKVNIIEDSIERGYKLDSLYNVLDSLYLLIQLVEQNSNLYKKDVLQIIFDDLDNISPDSLIEQNRLHLLGIQLRILLDSTIDQSDSLFLHETAFSCGFIEGKNSVLARALLGSYFGIELYEESECLMNEYMKGTSKSIKLQNLLDSSINELINSNNHFFSIYDIYGRHMQSNLSYFDLNNLNLPNGLYLVITNSHKFGCLKVSKLWLSSGIK
jgi:hypothetical protein